MDKKSSLNQILIILGLVGVAFYFGSSLKNEGDKKDIPAEEVSQQETQVQLQGMDAARQVASTLGVEMESFESCIADPETAEKVQNQQDLGEDIGVSGTPGAFLYDTTTKKSIKLGGAVPLEVMESELANLKAGKGENIEIAPITEEDFVKGDAKARYALIEWSDYECPFCGRFQESANQLVEKNSDVKWVYRQFPLDSLHPQTRQKSIAALCVGKIAGNDAFWEFSDTLLGL